MIPKRAIVVYDYGWINGGAAQVAIASAIALQRAGIQVDYFCAVGPIADAFEGSGVRVHCLEQPDILGDPNRLAAATRGLWNFAAAHALRRLLETCDPTSTIVHMHGWTKALSASVFGATDAVSMPLVTTLHEYFTACPNGGFFDYQENRLCTRRALSASCVAAHCDARNYPQKLWRVARQRVAQSAGRVPTGLRDVIFISELSRQLLAPYFASHTRWHAVHNPVEVERQARARAEANRTFLFVGRLSPEKGADLFAAAAVAAGVPARIVGAGEARETIARRWPSVELSGWMKRAEVGEALRASRALVFPSVWYEGQPLVVQEALAAGIPVIVADQTAAREAVRDGHNGLLFHHGDPESLPRAMARLADDATVARLSEHAYDDYWSVPPTLDAHIERLLAVYGDVLAQQIDA